MSEGNNLVGVDIGTSSIKVCEIREGRKGSRSLVRYGYHPLPPETIVDGHIMNSGAVAEGLEKLFHKAKSRNVALRASGHSVIIKKISMPMMTSEELSEQINWEAEQHIPFDLAEVQIDYQVLRQRQDRGQMDVLLVAAKKEEIADLTNVASEARLRPKVIDLDAFAVQNAFEAAYGELPPGETVVLVHTGASHTTLNILSDSTTGFTRDIANGGEGITGEIQRQMNISREEAEAYKCGGDGSGIVPKQVSEILAQVVEQLAGEIQRSLDFYLATSGDRGLNRIYFSGGTANIQALLDAVSRRANVPVEKLDPFRVAAPSGKGITGISDSQVHQLTVAMGLALRKERERRS